MCILNVLGNHANGRVLNEELYTHRIQEYTHTDIIYLGDAFSSKEV